MLTREVVDLIDSTDFKLAQRPSTADQGEQRHLVSSLNSAAESARTAWLGWLAALAFLFVTVGSVTHYELLLDSAIKLPLLSVEIPLTQFFRVTPLLIVFMHFGLLMQQASLVRKAAALNEALANWEADARQPHPLRHEINPYFSAQILAGLPTRGPLRAFWRIVALATLVLMPLLLLLFLQITFLPFHDGSTIWLQRICIICDLGFLVVFAITSRYPDEGLFAGTRSYVQKWRVNSGIVATTSLLLIFFSSFVATFPGEAVDRWASSLPWWSVSVPYGGEKSNRVAFWPTAYLFDGEVNHVTGRAGSLFSRNLILTDTKLTGGRAKGGDEGPLVLRGRDFRFGTFDRSSLAKADLTGSNFSQARLINSNLSAALLACAHPGRAAVARLNMEPTPDGPRWMSKQERLLAKHRPGCTDLSGADLTRASLAETGLVGANLSGATLASADLSGANLFYAAMNQADLSGANLRGANLMVATLKNAQLSGARLDGAVLISADMNGAQLEGASLIGTDLRHAKLIAANLSWAKLIGTDLGGADLRAARMIATSLIGTNIVAGVDVGHTFSGYLPGYMGSEGGVHSTVSQLALVDMRRARIGRASAPKPFDASDKSLDLIDADGVDPRLVGEIDLKELEDRLGSIKPVSLQQTLRSKLRPFIESVGKGESWNELDWKHLLEARETVEKASELRTSEMSKLVCDDTKSVSVLEGIIERADDYWYDGDDWNGEVSAMQGPNFDPRQLHQQVEEGNCATTTEVTPAIKLRLKQVAAKYERFKSRGTFQEGNTIIMIRVIPKSRSTFDETRQYGGQFGSSYIDSTVPNDSSAPARDR